MPYILDLLVPGLGHIAVRRWLSGALLVILWLIGLPLGLIAASFDVRAIVILVAIHPVLAITAQVHLIVARRREDPPRRFFAWSLALVPILAVVVIAGALFVTSSIVRPVVIRSGSMSPSVVTDDVILVQMFGPVILGLHVGDIVLMAHPAHAGRLLIKRIIGITGDLIQIRSGEFYRNGRSLSQCMLRTLNDHETRNRVIERLEVNDRRPYLVWDIPAVRSRAVTVRVPTNHLFVVGDNRDRSGDSRTFGTIPTSSVRGLVTVRISPVLTNQVYQAPIKARQAAYQRCSKRGDRQGQQQKRR